MSSTGTIDIRESSYFTTPRRLTASEPDSPSSVSPWSHPASTPNRSSRPPRPPVRPHARPRSDDVLVFSQTPVQTIDENQASTHSVPLSLSDSPLHKYRSSRNSAATQASRRESYQLQRAARSGTNSKGTSLSSFASVKSFASRYRQPTNLNAQRHYSTPATQDKPGPKHKRAWSESRTRGAKSLTSLPRRKTRSVENIALRHTRNSSESSSQIPVSSITPLRPPISPSISNQVLRRDIKLETLFSQSNTNTSQVAVHNEPLVSRRSSSGRPAAIFAAPLNAVRKLRKLSNTKTALPPESSSSPSVSDAVHSAMRGHMSQLRRKRTHEGLRQVSHLLRLLAGDKTDALPIEPKRVQARTMSEESGPFVKGSKDDKKVGTKYLQGLTPISAGIVTQKSMEIDQRGSDSSSIRILRLGPPPDATPDEQATYRIKRSPSAETEEFLKVDISIRGGTSYLPSEARRVHTPPLRSGKVDGKHRGFFFDYNPPGHLSADEHRHKTVDLSDGTRLLEGGPGIRWDWDEVKGKRSDTRAVMQTFDRGTYEIERTAKKIGVVDWYDTQLAGLDISTYHNALDKDKSRADTVATNFSEMRQRTALALHEMRNRNARAGRHSKDESGKQLQNSGTCKNGKATEAEEEEEEEEEEEDEEEGKVDFNIPEHYPNSPLCPANIKYWRFVDGKLDGTKYNRTCWMHGDLQT